MNQKELELMRGAYETRRPEYKVAVGHSIENGLQPGAKIIDFGAGDQSLLRFFNEVNFPVIYKGVDIETSEGGPEYFDLNQAKYPYQENEFDWGFCIETLEHLVNPYQGVGEMIRVCKNLTITVPTIKSKIKDYHEDPTHVFPMEYYIVDKMGFYNILFLDNIRRKQIKEVSCEEECNIILAVHHGPDF